MSPCSALKLRNRRSLVFVSSGGRSVHLANVPLYVSVVVVYSSIPLLLSFLQLLPMRSLLSTIWSVNGASLFIQSAAVTCNAAVSLRRRRGGSVGRRCRCPVAGVNLVRSGVEAARRAVVHTRAQQRTSLSNFTTTVLWTPKGSRQNQTLKAVSTRQ